MTTPTTTAVVPASATSCVGNGHVASAGGHRLPNAADDHRYAPTAPADEISALTVENTNLQAQLASLPVIEQAKGILIGRYQISPDAAFALLRRWSSHTNLKLRDISGLLVDAASHPGDQAGQVLASTNGRPPATAMDQLIDWLTNGAKTRGDG